MEKELVNVISFKGSNLDDMNDGVLDLLSRDVETAAIVDCEITREQYDALLVDGVELGFFSYDPAKEKGKRNALRLSSAFFNSVSLKPVKIRQFYIQELNNVTAILERLSENPDIMPVFDPQKDKVVVPATALQVG